MLLLGFSKSFIRSNVLLVLIGSVENTYFWVLLSMVLLCNCVWFSAFSIGLIKYNTIIEECILNISRELRVVWFHLWIILFLNCISDLSPTKFGIGLKYTLMVRCQKCYRIRDVLARKSGML